MTDIKEEHILWLSAEDFELVGDKEPLTQEKYEWILDYLRDYYNENFSGALAQALEDYSHYQ